MKIAILTLQHSNNYGAMLQAFALSKFLQHGGHETFFINYHQDVPSIYSYLRKPLLFVGKVIGKRALSFNFLGAKNLEARGKTVERDFLEIFEAFRIEHLNITDAPVAFAELSKNCPEADAIVVGSDQVWAADFVFSSPAYLLAFAPVGTRKIAYAASFGKARLEHYLRGTFKEHVCDFDAVSVREKSGVAIVRELSGLDPVHVLDPTLLISDYSEILDYSLVPEGDYALSYRLSQSADLSHWAGEATRAVAEGFKLPLYSVSTNAKGSEARDAYHLRPTPGQLLALIEKARILVTNSFHGTVFAMNFGTNFITLARDSAKDKQNLRLKELLEGVDAALRFCEPFLPVEQVSRRLAAELDFDAISRRLEPRRFESAEFLNHALRA